MDWTSNHTESYQTSNIIMIIHMMMMLMMMITIILKALRMKMMRIMMIMMMNGVLEQKRVSRRVLKGWITEGAGVTHSQAFLYFSANLTYICKSAYFV